MNGVKFVFLVLERSILGAETDIQGIGQKGDH
jgi:hypothetical protein